MRCHVGIREPELDPHLGKATCGGAGELLAWYPLRSADLGRVVSPGAVDFRCGRGVFGVCSGVGGLLMLLSSPRPAVVARDWKGMAPAFLFRVVCGLFLRCDYRVLKLLLAGHGGEGRRWLDVASVV
jgi:hypothetical protein